MKKTKDQPPKPNKKAKAKASAKSTSKAPAKAQSKARKDASGARAKGATPSRAKGPRQPRQEQQDAARKSLCPVSHACGACQMLDLPYEQQMLRKQAYMVDLFDGLVSSDLIKPILGMETPFYYRNKVISPYAPGRKLSQRAGAKGKAGEGKSAAGNASRIAGPRREILTGMYAKGTHKLVPTDGCLLENKIAKKVTLAVRDIMTRYDVAPYDEDAGTGFIRHAVVRVGHESGEVLVTLVTNGAEFPSSKAFCRELIKRVPQVTTVVQNVNERQTNVILGTQERTLYGPGFILDTLCGLSFRISSHSFYQVNATQTEVLYEQAIGLAGLTGTECAIDAYCGTGTIGLVAAKRGAARVIGVDSVESAIADARLNARHNGIENAEFVAADATKFMRELAAQPDAKPDDLVLFMDPPRAGSTEEFLDAAASMAPSRIVYISCNPETQRRDVAYLQKHGYRVELIQPVDMFPHTDHVESIALISRG